MRKLVFFAATALSAAMLAATAQAAVVFNSNLAPPGVYFGSGNPNGQFTVNTANGVEMGLRGKVYKGAAPIPSGNVYDIALGDVASFDYSLNPDVGGSQVSFAGVTSLLTIKNLATGGSFSFDPSLFDNSTNAGAPGGYQNSERLNFSFLNGVGGIGYNVNTNASYEITYQLTGGSFGPMTDSIRIDQGAGAVPEPATWAMMLFGIAMLGGGLRMARRKKDMGLATA